MVGERHADRRAVQASGAELKEVFQGRARRCAEGLREPTDADVRRIWCETDDMEIAPAWVEQATGVTGEGRESAALGGRLLFVQA